MAEFGGGELGLEVSEDVWVVALTQALGGRNLSFVEMVGWGAVRASLEVLGLAILSREVLLERVEA